MKRKEITPLHMKMANEMPSRQTFEVQQMPSRQTCEMPSGQTCETQQIKQTVINKGITH